MNDISRLCHKMGAKSILKIIQNFINKCRKIGLIFFVNETIIRRRTVERENMMQ